MHLLGHTNQKTDKQIAKLLSCTTFLSLVGKLGPYTLCSLLREMKEGILDLQVKVTRQLFGILNFSISLIFPFLL